MVAELYNLHSAIFPTYIICKILAITPYSIQGPPKCYELVVTKQDLIICITQNILLLGYCIYVTNTCLLEETFDHNLLMLTKHSQRIAIALSVIWNLTFFHTYRNEIFNILTSLTDIEQKLRQMRIAVDYRVVRRFSIIQIIMRLCLCFSIMAIHTFGLGSEVPLPTVIMYQIFTCIITMNSCYTSVLLFDIRYKYSLINVKLQQMISHRAYDTQSHLSEVSGMSSSVERNTVAELKTLINIHGRLYDLCRTMNGIYNVYFVLTLLACFIATVGGGFNIMNTLDNEEIVTVDVINRCIWTVYNIILVLILIQHIQACCMQANKTVHILNDIRYNNCSRALAETISTCVVLLNHHKLKFTACGLFTIDNTLLYTMLAAVSTHLIILYQFKKEV